MQDLETQQIFEVVKKHKLLILLILIVIGGISFFFFTSFYYGTRLAKVERAYPSPPYEYLYAPEERGIAEEAEEILTKETEYKIKRGSAYIKSSNAEGDYNKVKEKVESLNGWIETMSKTENFREISIVANLKIPAEEFDSFADWLLNNFDVKRTNFEFYKVSIERQQDEIQILLQALEVYDRLLQRAEAMNVSRDSIEVIMEITQKKLEIMRLLKQYGYSVEKVEERAKYASLSLTITQEKKIKLIPEELGKEFRTRVRNMVRDIVNAGMDLVTIPIVILVKVLVWIVYAFIVLIPIFIAFKIILKIYGMISKKFK